MSALNEAHRALWDAIDGYVSASAGSLSERAAAAIALGEDPAHGWPTPSNTVGEEG